MAHPWLLRIGLRKILSLIIIGLLCFSTFTILTPQTKEEEWNVERITTGFAPSLIIDNQGRPHISYYDGSYLGYTTRIDNIWQVEVVDNRHNHTGFCSSIAVDNNGNPHISYQDFHLDARCVMYASYVGGSWTLEEVDKVGDDRQRTSLTIKSDGTPIIAYYGGINDELKLASKSGVSWTKETVDLDGDVGKGVSLILDSHGNPRISYCDRAEGKLRYAEWIGGSWNIEVVDSCTVFDKRSSISLGLDRNDNPSIAYRSSAGMLKYARWNGTLWIIETVVGDSVSQLSLTMDSGDNPHIIYCTFYCVHAQILRYAVKDGDTWKTETISRDMGNAGLSLALDANNMKIGVAYEGIPNYGDLNYVEGTYEPLSPPIERTYNSITIISPQDIVYHISSVDLDYFVDIPTLWIGYSLDDRAIETLSGSTILKRLKNGLHNITLFATDTLGNTHEASVEFVVDSNPAVLFIIPDYNNFVVTFEVANETMRRKTEFPVGECVLLSIFGDWHRAESHEAFGGRATVVISNETGHEVWSRTVDLHWGPGWGAGGVGIGIPWRQIDNLGNTVPAGTYKTSIRITANPGFDFPEDHYDVISFRIID